MKKNSLVNWINKGKDFDPALIHCLKSECDRWDKAERFSIRKIG